MRWRASNRTKFVDEEQKNLKEVPSSRNQQNRSDEILLLSISAVAGKKIQVWWYYGKIGRTQKWNSNNIKWRFWSGLYVFCSKISTTQFLSVSKNSREKSWLLCSLQIVGSLTLKIVPFLPKEFAHWGNKKTD